MIETSTEFAKRKPILTDTALRKILKQHSIDTDEFEDYLQENGWAELVNAQGEISTAKVMGWLGY